MVSVCRYLVSTQIRPSYAGEGSVDAAVVTPFHEIRYAISQDVQSHEADHGYMQLRSMRLMAPAPAAATSMAMMSMRTGTTSIQVDTTWISGITSLGGANPHQ